MPANLKNKYNKNYSTVEDAKRIEDLPSNFFNLTPIKSHIDDQTPVNTTEIYESPVNHKKLVEKRKSRYRESEIKDNKEKRSNSRSNSRLSSSNSKYKKQTNRKNDYKVPESKEYYSKRKQKVYEKKTYYKRESRSSSISKTSSSHSKNIKEECKDKDTENEEEAFPEFQVKLITELNKIKSDLSKEVNDQISSLNNACTRIFDEVIKVRKENYTIHKTLKEMQEKNEVCENQIIKCTKYIMNLRSKSSDREDTKELRRSKRSCKKDSNDSTQNAGKQSKSSQHCDSNSDITDKSNVKPEIKNINDKKEKSINNFSKSPLSKLGKIQPEADEYRCTSEPCRNEDLIKMKNNMQKGKDTKASCNVSASNKSSISKSKPRDKVKQNFKTLFDKHSKEDRKFKNQSKRLRKI